MSETRYAIRMTTAKGEFWWTGSMSDMDDAGHGRFRSFGWSADNRRTYTYERSNLAAAKAQDLASSLRRMFDLDIEVVEVHWSVVLGWLPVAAEATP